MDLNKLQTELESLQQPAFRNRQIWQWLAEGHGSFEVMTNLPEALRDELTQRLPISTLDVKNQVQSSDGTIKTLFYTGDKRAIEAVLMSYSDGRRSLCVSSQSGCPLTCKFCATGSMKFGRNLTAWEILDQALHFRRVGSVNHVIFMGMGEPMMNLENVLTACKYFPDIGISHRHTAISTVGWIPGIERLAKSDMPIRLALSLHAPDEDLRNELMPVNERYGLSDVLAACDDFYRHKRRRIFVEYVMLAGVNDHYRHAQLLAKRLNNKRYKINLIPYNPTGSPYDGSSPKVIRAFRDVLIEHGFDATIRVTRGQDIDAACGQLAARDAADNQKA